MGAWTPAFMVHEGRTLVKECLTRVRGMSSMTGSVIVEKRPDEVVETTTAPHQGCQRSFDGAPRGAGPVLHRGLSLRAQDPRHPGRLPRVDRALLLSPPAPRHGARMMTSPREVARITRGRASTH